MSHRVWRADPAEAETVARLLIGFRDHFGRDWPSDNAFLAGVERLIDNQECEFLLGAVDDDSPPQAVCQLRYRFGIWQAATDCWLEDLYVEPEARRSGLGRAVVEAAAGFARQRGCRRLELDVSEENEPALALYRSIGFSFKSDPARDLLLRLPLDDR
ncbi:MAG: GNAT family N-acetyltransferase [Actinomycetes bacterium]